MTNIVTNLVLSATALGAFTLTNSDWKELDSTNHIEFIEKEKIPILFWITTKVTNDYTASNVTVTCYYKPIVTTTNTPDGQTNWMITFKP